MVTYSVPHNRRAAGVVVRAVRTAYRNPSSQHRGALQGSCDRAGLAVIGRAVIDDDAVLCHAALEGDGVGGREREGAEVQSATAHGQRTGGGQGGSKRPPATSPPLTVVPPV